MCRGCEACRDAQVVGLDCVFEPVRRQEYTLSIVIIWLGLDVAVALVMNWSFRGRSFVRPALALP